MPWRKTTSGALLALCLWAAKDVRAGDLRISFPKHSKATPVQKLNREGVEAIRRHDYEKAKTLFYKAYLFDPNDPFTLNNLGYISELEGRADRAQRFYDLATREETGAVIDLASTKQVEGQSVQEFVSGIQDRSMQINRANVEAVNLLSNDRPAEAEAVLEPTLRLDPHNPFTLNNLGVAKEMQGDFEQALKYYNAVADAHSHAPVVVTTDRAWRGKPVSEMAEESAKRVRASMRGMENVDVQVARLNLRGVSAINRNDWKDAEQYFRRAYQLDSNNAFSLNNLGFVAEMSGDEETAQEFYEKARNADRANVAVGVATRQSEEGRKLFEVADDNDNKADIRLARQREVRRRETGPIRLKRRDGSVVEPEPEPVPAQPQSLPPAQPQPANPPQQ